MTITLRPEQARIIQEQIAQGRYDNPADVLDDALAALQAVEAKRRTTLPRKSLAQFLMESPLAGAGLDLERRDDAGRDIKLCAGDQFHCRAGCG